MERKSPFAEVLFWKRMIGWGMVLGAAAAALITLGPGSEAPDGVDMVIWTISGLAAIGGLGLLLSPDPARL